MRQIEAVNAQTGPVMMAYPAAPEHRRHARARAAERDADVDVTADDGVRHQLWVIGDDADDRRLSRARSTRCRRSTSPTAITARPRRSRVAEARGGGASGVARLFPRCDLPASPDDHPRLQPRAARLERPQRRSSCSPKSRRRFTVEPSRPAGAARRTRSEFGMVLAGRWYRLTIRRAELVPASDDPIGAAADHAARPQHDRAALRHHRSAHRQAHRLRRRRPRPCRTRAARQLRRDGGGVRALPDADGAT